MQYTWKIPTYLKATIFSAFPLDVNTTQEIDAHSILPPSPFILFNQNIGTREKLVAAIAG
jgi:hypothetical protein